ncbi:MAG TPA: hypothetical protein VNT26_18635, partial [Candidatus Sulfotelmatobacter sp.]|nr:hypothetical protein [Candidatus Sulfotelmatobacter sp.]
MKALPATAVTNLATPGANSLHDIKPPLEIPSGWAWVGWVAGALVCAALLAWAWCYWQKRKSEVSPAPLIPPHVRARQQLQ